jgi:hypothetical protein
MPVRPAGGLLILLLLCIASPALAQRGAERQCSVVTALTAVPGLREGSSLAISRSTPRRLFTLNDSDAPVVVVLDLDGTVRGQVAVQGATVTDWEDITAAPCDRGNCLYVSDIGDNASKRTSVSIYQMAEPADGVRDVAATRFVAVYPDGPHDAEAIFADRSGRLYLLTKERRAARLYAFPPQLQTDQPNRLQLMATLTSGTGRLRFARITDAETSPDGRTVAVRSNDALFLLPTDALLRGQLDTAAVFSLRHLGEPQGEGVALASSDDVFLVGEGAKRRATGTFARVSCTTGQ